MIVRETLRRKNSKHGKEADTADNLSLDNQTNSDKLRTIKALSPFCVPDLFAFAPVRRYLPSRYVPNVFC